MHAGLNGNRERYWKGRTSFRVLGTDWRLLDEIEIRVNSLFGKRYAFAFVCGDACFTEEEDCRHCEEHERKTLINRVDVIRMLKSKSIDEIVQEIETEIAIYKVQ